MKKRIFKYFYLIMAFVLLQIFWTNSAFTSQAVVSDNTISVGTWESAPGEMTMTNGVYCDAAGDSGAGSGNTDEVTGNEASSPAEFETPTPTPTPTETLENSQLDEQQSEIV